MTDDFSGGRGSHTEDDDPFEAIARLIEVGRISEAKGLLHAHSARHPYDLRGPILAGHLALIEGDAQTAENLAGEALSLDPGNRSAREVLFSALVEQQRLGEAEQLILDLIREDPDDGELLAEYAFLMLCTLHVEKAAALSEEAERLAPQSDEVRLTATLVALVQRDRSRSVRVEQLVRENPECRRIAALLLVYLTDQRRFAEALELGQQLLRASPDDEDLVEALIQLRVATHWVAIPARPLQRWGWFGSGVLWFVAVVLMLGSAFMNPLVTLTVAVLYLLYCAYSWIHAPLLTKWIRSRGLG